MQRSFTPMACLARCAALFLMVFSTQLLAETDQPIRISIIIDDMGDHRDAGLRAIQLPGAVTYAFLPHAPHSNSLANTAHNQNKEVMLHLPMQAIGSNHLGPGGLTLDMNRDQFQETLKADLASVPHVAGINNHMGSLLTRHPGHMQWLMEDIRQLETLYFIDSRTTHHTVANKLANEHQVPSRQRDVFLDDDPSPDAVINQFNRLIEKANKQGSAIGIGHPYDSTLSVLAVMIPQLKHMDIELVPVSHLVYQSPPVRMANEAPTQLQPAAPPGPFVLNTTTEIPAATPHLHHTH